MCELMVAYRCYPKLSRPAPFNITSKEQLVAGCLVSLKEALHGVDFRMAVNYDDCYAFAPLVENLFKDQLCCASYKNGNAGSFGWQLDLLTGCTASKYVLFVEDDYLWRLGAVKPMLDTLRLGLCDYVTPYNHPDCHAEVMAALWPRRPPAVRQIRAVSGRNWYHAPSTCLTFATSRRLLAEDKAEFARYTTGRSYDFAIWVALTKKPAHLWRRDWRYYAFTLWRHHKRLLSGQRRVLYAPLTSAAVHMVQGQIDQEKEWEQRWKEVA